MKALRFERFGDPDVLRQVTVATPRADGDTAIVAVRAASINPSDLGNVAGRFPQTTLPRIPGRDYSGVVVDGPAAWIGVEVWGTGNAGFARDGSHAEAIAVPVASLRRKPATLSHAEAASIGVNFAAAWLGVVDYARLAAGETLVVIGAAGGVGGAAVQIGHRIGARVIGIDRAAPHPESPAARLADRIVTPEPAESAAMIRELTGGRGAAVVLNAVGGATFEPSLAMLAPRGRLAVLASPGQRRASFDLLDFYHNESQLFGVDTLKRDMVESAALLEALTPGFEAGGFQPPVIERAVGLDQAVEAYRAVAAGTRGRVVLLPDAG
ncbi:MAG: zinc-binding alcohol dehydrogenase family protein [Azospirillaceae bacterium]|nr:zinc-binding alcohol dehydrogenase family protein [Azospirillaceae bacterium]